MSFDLEHKWLSSEDLDMIFRKSYEHEGEVVEAKNELEGPEKKRIEQYGPDRLRA